MDPRLSGPARISASNNKNNNNNHAEQKLAYHRGHSVATDLPAELVRAQLEHILTSSVFVHAERASRMLRFVVETTLLGHAEQIKEYCLGVEVLDRGDSFDPQVDPIARVEAGRLRRKLEEYYRLEGRNDSIVIDLPKGQYVPVFQKRQPPRSKAETDAASHPVARHRKGIWTSAALLMAGGLIAYGSYSLGRANANRVRPGGADDLTSVAVMPFVNSDADPDVEAFTDGLTEEVIETLAEVEGLRVASRTSAFQFKGKQLDVRTVGATLNVRAVLEGAVHRSGSHLRVTSRLLNAADGTQYYSHVYEHELKDAFAIQMEIAGQVANALQVRQKGEEVARFTKSAEAHKWYLQGLSHASRLSESELRQAIDCYQRAIVQDRNYSPAYTGLSDAFITLGLLNEAPPRVAMQRAAEAARSAVKTGDTYAHAHAALGSVLALYEWDWAGAEKEFDKAIGGDPNDSSILQQYAMRDLVPQGHLDSALFELQLAQKVDPFSPQVMLNRGRVAYFERDPQRAIRAFQSALEFDPHFEVVPLALAEAYLQSSLFDQAAKTLNESTNPTEDEARLAVLGSVYGLSRQPERARHVLHQLEEVARHQHISGYYFSQVYLALDETKAALDSLEEAAQERSPLIVYVNVAPQFERLRTEPRFHALLKRIGLERGVP